MNYLRLTLMRSSGDDHNSAMLKPRFDPFRFSRPAGPTQQQRRVMISESAYGRARARGFVGGSAVEDWLAAEAEVDFALSFQSIEQYG